MYEWTLLPSNDFIDDGVLKTLHTWLHSGVVTTLLMKKLKYVLKTKYYIVNLIKMALNL